MPSVPDQPSPHHHQPSPAAPVTLDDLRRIYGDSWEILGCPAGRPVYTADHKSGDGRHLRYIVAHTAADLAAKLASATVVEP